MTVQIRPTGGQAEHTCCHHLVAARAVCADRERELLELKGPCGDRTCRLHYAHSGPCDARPAPTTKPTLRDIQAAPHADINLQLRKPVAARGAAPGRVPQKG